MVFNLLSETHFKLAFAILLIGSFFITFFAIKFFKRMLPKDQGRQFAVNGALSEGKPRGAGLILITSFTLCAALFVPLNAELVIYLVLLYAAMITGFLDDAAKNPWGELKKGLLDLVIAVGIVVNFIYYNDTTITIFGKSFVLLNPVYAVLGVVLVWASINVTNCSDGVDGLCATLFCISLVGFMPFLKNIFIGSTMILNDFTLIGYVMLMSTLAYLWFNTSPSKLLMGDAGSRALGVFLAITAMKTGRPLLFLPICVMLIIDGGSSLLKLSCRRFLKMKNFMEGVRTPIHDHMRKNKGWSDTQVVIRFTIIQIVVVLVAKFAF